MTGCGTKRQFSGAAVEACDALLFGAGPGLIPRDVDGVRDCRYDWAATII